MTLSACLSVQRSPPLRRGTRSKVSGKDQPDGYSDMKADPGMVLNYKAQEEVQPQPAAAQPNLLDFDGLSMDAPPAAGAQVCAQNMDCRSRDQVAGMWIPCAASNA